MVLIVIKSLLPVILVVSLGFALRELKIVPEARWMRIDLITYWLLFPILVMGALIQMNLSRISLGSLSKSYLTAVIALIFIIWIIRNPLRRYLGINDRTFSSIFQTSTRWNALIALAIAKNLAGDQGLAVISLIVAITLPFLNFVNIVVLTICCSDSRPTVTITAINTLKVPLIWSAVIGLLLNMAKVSICEPLLIGFDIIGRAGIGVGLLSVGAGLHINTLFNAKMPVLIGIITKLLIFPLLVFTSCMIFQVNGLTLQIAMLSAAVPTATTG